MIRRRARLFNLGLGCLLALLLLLQNGFFDSNLVPLVKKRVKYILPMMANVTETEDYDLVTPAYTVDVYEDSEARRLSERKEFKERMCQRLNVGGYIKTKEYMYYSKSYKLLVCAPPKTGCSSIKRHMLKLAGVGKLKVHSTRARKAIAASQVLGKSVKKVLKSSTLSTLVEVVRHPLERLVSGYREKFKNGAPISGMWGNFVRKYRKSRGIYSANRTLNFHEFLEMIAYKMETKGRNSIDRHFRPTTLLCSPCGIKYDYILHTDTLTQDLQYLVGKLNLTGISVSARMNSKANKTRGITYESYYNDIPVSLMGRIYTLFKEDFLINNFKVLPSMQSVTDAY